MIHLARDLWCSKLPSWLRHFLFYAVWANVPFWIATHTQGLVVHGWICFDYLAIGIISLFLSRPASAVLLGIAMALDLLASVSETYYLIPSQILFSYEALWQFSPIRLLSIAGIGVLLILIACSTLYLPRPDGAPFWRAKAAVALVSLSLVCLMAELAQASLHSRSLTNSIRGLAAGDVVNREHFTRTRPARYPTKKLVDLEMLELRTRALAGQSQFQVSNSVSASAIVLGYAGLPWHRADEMPNIVLIVVESWGLSDDPAIRDSLVSPYEQDGLATKYKILQGSVPFYGPTVMGEVRELCGSTSGFEVLNAPKTELMKCLPDRLAALGYRSVALHGMDGHLFHRIEWYRTIGFDEVWFRDRFRAQNLPNCPGAFSGTCDASIADWMDGRLKQSGTNPQFIYWMTLNSHLPLPNPPLLQNPASCSFTDSVRQTPALCSWYQLEDNVHRAIAKLALSVSARPTVFIIVGDHAPPFSEPELRAGFSGSVVPYIILIPNRLMFQP